MNLRIYIITIFLFGFFIFAKSQTVIKGVVIAPDSISTMPFVYVINLQSGNGQMSDGNGHYTVEANNNDTILFSYIGFLRLKVPVSRLQKSGKVIMHESAYKLSQVVVSDFKLKPYEKDYMKRVINGSKQNVVNAMESPITALYMQFSRKGKEQRKLAQIFENMFIEEQVAKKFNAETLRSLTGDENIDFEKFRKYCYYLSNDYIVNHDGYDLYYRVMDCYYRWKSEKR